MLQGSRLLVNSLEALLTVTRTRLHTRLRSRWTTRLQSLDISYTRWSSTSLRSLSVSERHAPAHRPLPLRTGWPSGTPEWKQTHVNSTKSTNQRPLSKARNAPASARTGLAAGIEASGAVIHHASALPRPSVSSDRACGACF